VFMVKNNTAVETQVTTGKSFDSYVEIKSGIKRGDQVIDSVPQKIKNGEKVKVQE